MIKAKILVLGPCASGKTTVSNFLSDATETFGGDYHPTQGVRIVEFEVPLQGKRSGKMEIELWDCSGDRKFEACWPAIARDVNGIVFVFNPDQPNHDKELEQWYAYFADQQGIRSDQCLILAHSKEPGQKSERTKLSGALSSVRLVRTNLDDDAESLRDEFAMFTSSLADAMSRNNEQEELNIMNDR